MENEIHSKLELIFKLESQPLPVRIIAYWIMMNMHIVLNLNSFPIPDSEQLERLIQKAKEESDFDNLVLLYYQRNKQRYDNNCG